MIDLTFVQTLSLLETIGLPNLTFLVDQGAGLEQFVPLTSTGTGRLGAFPESEIEKGVVGCAVAAIIRTDPSLPDLTSIHTLSSRKIVHLPSLTFLLGRNAQEEVGIPLET